MNILFTCAGRRNYLVNYFREALGGKGIIVAADMHSTAPAFAVADKAVVVPAVFAPDYIETILEICKTERIDAVISLNDLELPLIAAAREEFERAGVTLVLSSAKVIDICYDKWKTCEFAQSHGLRVPKTFLSVSRAKAAIANNELSFPLVVKPRWGSASIGVEFPQNMEQLELAYRLLKGQLSHTILGEVSKKDEEQPILVQEKIQGKEYGLDVLNDFNANPVQVFVKEKLSMRAGETDKAVLRNNRELEQIGFQIGKSLGHIGNLDCDVFERGGQYYLLELNPRFGGGYPFSQMSGARFPDAIVAWLGGAPYDFGKNVKTYDITYAKCDTLVNVSADPRIDIPNTMVWTDKEQERSENRVQPGDEYGTVTVASSSESVAIKQSQASPSAMPRVVIYGAGGLGREVAMAVRLDGRASALDVVAFVDDDPGQYGNDVDGIPVRRLETVRDEFPDAKLLCAMAEPRARCRSVEHGRSLGMEFVSFVHESAIISPSVHFGEGCIISAGCILTTDVVVGDFVFINLQTTLGHNVRVGNYCTIGPGVRVGGYVNIMDRARVNMGALIVNGTRVAPVRVGADAQVGAGSCVIASVPDGCSVFGNPARNVPFPPSH